MTLRLLPLLQLVRQLLLTLLKQSMVLLTRVSDAPLAKQLLTLLLLFGKLLLQTVERMLQGIKLLLFTGQIELQVSRIAPCFRQLRLNSLSNRSLCCQAYQRCCSVSSHSARAARSGNAN